MSKEVNTSLVYEEVANLIIRNYWDDSELVKTLPEAKKLKNADKVQQIVRSLEIYREYINSAKIFIKSSSHNPKLVELINRLDNLTEEEFLSGEKTLFGKEDFTNLCLYGQFLYKNNDLDNSSKVFLFTSLMFPFKVQPIVYLNTISWRTQGISYAANAYEKMLSIMKHPLFYLYAGDCFKAANKIELAKQTFEEALEMCKKDKSYNEYKKELQDELKSF